MTDDHFCTQGHDLCYVTTPGPECPTCERFAPLRREAQRHFSRMIRAMVVFDRTDEVSARGRAYMWLAGELHIPRHRCLIKNLSAAQCRKTVELCQARRSQITGEENAD